MRRNRQYGRTAHKKRKSRSHGKQKRAERVRENERHQAQLVFRITHPE